MRKKHKKIIIRAIIRNVGL